MKTKSLTIKLLAINYSIFITLLITLELAGQIGYRIFAGRFLFQTPPNQVFEEHPYLSGVPKHNFRYVNKKGLTVTTDAHGFRITSKHAYRPDAVNVVCLGGSTTFGILTTDEDSWPFMLQEKLGADYNVFNLGVPGYTTLEAMIQLITIVPELNPHVIIVYQGWNDIRNYHVRPSTPDFYWHGMNQKSNLEFGSRTLWDYFFITKLAKRIGQILNPPSANLSNAKTFASNDPYVDSLYSRNLKTIKLLCDNLNAKTIFIPQVLNVDSLLRSSGTYTWTPHIENKQMPVLMEGFNALMTKAIHADQNTVVINGIQKKYPWTREHFGDIGHFNRAGGVLFTEIIKAAIVELKVDKRESSPE